MSSWVLRPRGRRVCLAREAEHARDASVVDAFNWLPPHGRRWPSGCASMGAGGQPAQKRIESPSARAACFSSPPLCSSSAGCWPQSCVRRSFEVAKGQSEMEHIVMASGLDWTIVRPPADEHPAPSDLGAAGGSRGNSKVLGFAGWRGIEADQAIWRSHEAPPKCGASARVMVSSHRHGTRHCTRLRPRFQWRTGRHHRLCPDGSVRRTARPPTAPAGPQGLANKES